MRQPLLYNRDLLHPITEPKTHLSIPQKQALDRFTKQLESSCCSNYSYYCDGLYSATEHRTPLSLPQKQSLDRLTKQLESFFCSNYSYYRDLVHPATELRTPTSLPQKTRLTGLPRCFLVRSATEGRRTNKHGIGDRCKQGMHITKAIRIARPP